MAIYDKKYFEKYAMLSLVYCFDSELAPMLMGKSESPDWQSDELDLGIEVCRALSKKQGEENSIVNRYFGQGLLGEEIQKEVARRFPKYKDSIHVHEHVAYTSKDYTTFDEKYREIEACIIRKTRLLNSGIYKVFSSNWLYIFADTALLQSWDIELIQNRVREKNVKMKVKYDVIVINAIDKLWIVKKDSEYMKKELNDEMLAFLKKEAQ